jgi:hypothetical protein
MAIVDAKDIADVLAIFLGLESDTIRKAKIVNLNEALDKIKFLDVTNMPVLVPKTILGYPIPDDLNYQTICRYEDIKTLATKCVPAKNEKLSSKHLNNYVQMAGIYAMPNYEEASEKERDEFISKFYDAPCGEVMAIGNFTVMRLTVSSVKGSAIFLNLLTRMHKLRLALKSFNARLGFSLRFFIWKRKHRISGMNS